MAIASTQTLAPATGLFLITDVQQASRYREIVDGIQHTYGIETTTKWVLDYNHYISRPETAKSKGEPASSQHVLHLSHLRSHVFIALDQPSDTPSTGSTTDQPTSATAATQQQTPLFVVKLAEAQKDSALALINTKMPLLWSLKSSLHVSGTALALPNGIVRVGEVRTATNASNVRALLVAVEVDSVLATDGRSVAPEEQERVRWEVGRIRGDVGLDAVAREGWAWGDEQSVVAAWCEIMRLR